jgi:hypothetical protein
MQGEITYNVQPAIQKEEEKRRKTRERKQQQLLEKEQFQQRINNIWRIGGWLCERAEP